MKKWIIISKEKPTNLKKITEILLSNRGLKSKEEIENFLNPSIEESTLKSAGIANKAFVKLHERLKNAFEKNEKIIIFGDYDVDGICGTAVLWETIYEKYKNVFPYIPERIEEGYGLSKKGIDNVLTLHPDTTLILTVDNGIVANEAIEYAKEKGIDVVITDHHAKSEKIPNAFCIIHTTALCGAGIAWMLSREFNFVKKEKISDLLSLAAIATIADLVPLKGINRAIVKMGIAELKKSKRPGLLSLFREAAVNISEANVYNIAYIIAPRLNASGRIQSAMNALRLLCTNDESKGIELAKMLNGLNRERQELTLKSFEHAKLLSVNASSSRVTVVASENYNQGIIGLIASKMVESYHRPSFAISIGKEVSKGSARSIKGVNIIEMLRSVKSTLIEAGGHPMAAGFSLKTGMIKIFEKEISKRAEITVSEELLERKIYIDCELQFNIISENLLSEIGKFEPYGMGNNEPIFSTSDVKVRDSYKIGKEKNHLRLKLEKDGRLFEAVLFGFKEDVDVAVGNTIDVCYSISTNEWNGEKKIQLKIKDIAE